MPIDSVRCEQNLTDDRWLDLHASDIKYIRERVAVGTDMFTRDLYERADELERGGRARATSMTMGRADRLVPTSMNYVEGPTPSKGLPLRPRPTVAEIVQCGLPFTND
jgi:hypothetical protein